MRDLEAISTQVVLQMGTGAPAGTPTALNVEMEHNKEQASELATSQSTKHPRASENDEGSARKRTKL